MLELGADIQEIVRGRLLDSRQPSKRLIRMYLEPQQRCARDRPGHPVRVLRKPAWASQMTDPDLVVDWLEATVFLKDVRTGKEAAKTMFENLRENFFVECVPTDG